ncbi:hypothetical protein HK102_011736 [Quaeritorhiza haematococci]|nr:hypothetical protein HK102_011736 [Quaeritorhiza haematococci]
MAPPPPTPKSNSNNQSANANLHANFNGATDVNVDSIYAAALSLLDQFSQFLTELQPTERVTEERNGVEPITERLSDFSREGSITVTPSTLHTVRDGDGSVYTRLSTVVPGSTIGKHVRHVLDHFRLLLSGCPHSFATIGGKEAGREGEAQTSCGNGPTIEKREDNQQQAEWTVNYDARERNGLVESNISTALLEIGSIRELITRMTSIDSSESNGHEAELESSHAKPTPHPISSPSALLLHPVHVEVMVNPEEGQCVPMHSTFGRELWFATHHAIHHAALIRAICVENRVRVPREFGLAPSTAHYNRHKGQRDG